MNRTELKISYDKAMKPISATCTVCGERMPSPPAELQNSADIIMWLSEKYIEHQKLKHVHQDRRRFARD